MCGLRNSPNGFGRVPKSLDTRGLKPNVGLYVLYVTFKKLYFAHTIRTVREYLPTGINWLVLMVKREMVNYEVWTEFYT